MGMRQLVRKIHADNLLGKPIPIAREALNHVHIKVLLNWYHIARGSGALYAADVPYKGKFIRAKMADIKAEMDTREHIPTGVEARKIRQKKALAKKNR